MEYYYDVLNESPSPQLAQVSGGHAVAAAPEPPRPQPPPQPMSLLQVQYSHYYCIFYLLVNNYNSRIRSILLFFNFVNTMSESYLIWSSEEYQLGVGGT